MILYNEKASCFTWNMTNGSIAQGIEHWFPKPCVVGSNPTGAIRLKLYVARDAVF